MGRKSTWSAVWNQTYDKLCADGIDSDVAVTQASAAARAAEQARRGHRRAMNAEYQRRHRAKVRLEKRRLIGDVAISIRLPRDAVEVLDQEVRQVHSDLPREAGRALLIAALIASLKDKHPNL